MNLVDRARRDAKRIVNNDVNGFGTAITLSTIVDEEEVSEGFIGTAKRHNIVFDETGAMVNATNATVTLCIKDLEDSAYPYKASSGKIFLKNHTVKFSDSTGEQTYIVQEQLPDEYLGLIVLILGNGS